MTPSSRRRALLERRALGPNSVRCGEPVARHVRSHGACAIRPITAASVSAAATPASIATTARCARSPRRSSARRSRRATTQASRPASRARTSAAEAASRRFVPPAISPSCIRSARSARAATRASCVTSTMAGPVAAQLVEQVDDGGRGAAVEVAGRLVGQHDRGLVDHRPRDRDPLLLAARHPRREVAGALRDAEPLEQIVGARARLRRAHPAERADHLDVLARGQRGHEVQRLEHVADRPAPQLGPRRLAERVDAPALERGACRRRARRARRAGAAASTSRSRSGPSASRTRRR